MSQSKTRLLELNARLAQNLVDKGVEATAEETTTALVCKVTDIPTPKEEQEKTVDITENGTTEILPEEDKAISKVTVNVNVPSSDSFYDIFWDTFQQNGERVNYEKAFTCEITPVWSVMAIKPKYNLTVNVGNSMFRGISDLEDISDFLNDGKISLEFVKNPQTQALAQAGYMFSGCTNLVSVVDLDLEKVSTIIYMFNSCTSLETVHLKNLQSSTTVSGAFYQCVALKSVTIEGEIGNNISFAHSSLLTTESVQSVIDALADLTGQTAQILTLHADTKVEMSDEQIASITAKNWTLA